MSTKKSKAPDPFDVYIPGPSDNVIHRDTGRHIGTCAGSVDEKSFCLELNTLHRKYLELGASRLGVQGFATPDLRHHGDMGVPPSDIEKLSDEVVYNEAVKRLGLEVVGNRRLSELRDIHEARRNLERLIAARLDADVKYLTT